MLTTRLSTAVRRTTRKPHHTYTTKFEQILESDAVRTRSARPRSVPGGRGARSARDRPKLTHTTSPAKTAITGYHAENPRLLTNGAPPAWARTRGPSTCIRKPLGRSGDTAPAPIERAGQMRASKCATPRPDITLTGHMNEVRINAADFIIPAPSPKPPLRRPRKPIGKKVYAFQLKSARGPNAPLERPPRPSTRVLARRPSHVHDGTD